MSSYDYIAYIDESGDPGLNKVRPNHPSGASEWLILSAVVVAERNENNMVRWVKEICKQINSQQSKGFHFRNLNPAKKRLVCSYLATKPVRVFVVASNKKNMERYENQKVQKYEAKGWFYWWLTRILMERVTNFVKCKSLEEYGEPRKLRVEFSKRGGMKYSEMLAYFHWLKNRNETGRNFFSYDLEWDVVDFDQLKVYPHEERMGLVWADVAAHSFFRACDTQRGVDVQFAKLLNPRMGRFPDRRGGIIAGYGLKLMPYFFQAGLTPEQKEIFTFYGYPNEWQAPDPSS